MSISFWIVSRWSPWIIGWPPPPSMKKTTALAPSKTLSSSGQPPATNDRVDARDLLEALDQQLAAGVELVVARPVAGPAGDQDDLGVSAAAAGAGAAAPGQARAASRQRPISFLMACRPRVDGASAGRRRARSDG